MHWLLKSPVHQQACYWLCRTGNMYCCSRVDLIYLDQSKSKILFKMWLSFIILKQFSMLRVKSCPTNTGIIAHVWLPSVSEAILQNMGKSSITKPQQNTIKRKPCAYSLRCIVHKKGHCERRLNNNKIPTGGHLNIKMSSYQYRDPHVKDKTVSRPSNL